MKKEYGTALKEFLKNRDINNCSNGLKKIYSESKTWDSFIDDARFYGFKWSQIYFAKEIVDLYKPINPNYTKWLLLHLQFQYEIGNLRTLISDIQLEINSWYTIDTKSFILSDFINSIPDILQQNIDIFGVINEPFIVENGYIYINKIQKYENKFLELLDERLNSTTNINFDFLEVKQSIERDLGYNIDECKLEAIEKALKHNFVIISGGPGTGKTTTVLSIIKALKFIGLHRIALAAPTGRAAKRMVESMSETSDIESFTLHKLLGIIPNKETPRYNRNRQLPVDVVIIDEASMVDIHMMYRLFDALSPTTKLILVGDKDQLPSVEAGALLGDFLYNHTNKNHKMFNKITILTKTYRSAKGIMDVANKIIEGNSQLSLEMLNKNNNVVLNELKDIDLTVSDIISMYKLENLEKSFKVSVSDYKSVEESINKYFDIYNDFTVLTPSKKGIYGTYSLNTRIKRVLNPNYLNFYHGEPIMITKNDYINGLFNGDRGVVFKFGNGMFAFFKDSNRYKVISISKISDYETCYAGTVHKSQGSEFNKVLIIIPEGSDKLLTREILYTAITRAKKSVIILSSETEIITAVNKGIKRESGIRDYLIDN